MDDFMFWLVGLLHGADGLTLLILVALLFMLHLVVRADDDRRDARRRNHAHRVR